MSPVPAPFYERPSLNVETYDARAGVTIPGSTVDGDVAFFTDLAARTGGPILELGCGTGRVTWALAEAGHEIVGLDRSIAMLASAEAKRASKPGAVAARTTFVAGDMTAFELGRQFALVVIPFRAFMAVLDPAGQRACFEAVRRHLVPGGRFVVDLFDPRLEWCLPSVDLSARRDRELMRHPDTGREVEVEILSRHNDPYLQRLTEEFRFRELDEHGATVREELEVLTLRWTYRYEARYLLELAGFEIEAEHGGFHGEAPAYAAEQVWVARRPLEPTRP
jgi:SAM-dependent methyltransferase